MTDIFPRKPLDSPANPWPLYQTPDKKGIQLEVDLCPAA